MYSSVNRLRAAPPESFVNNARPKLVHEHPQPSAPADEQLMREVASGRQEAIGQLYARYSPLLFGLAAQALDRATAEEIVQDVFLAVRKNAASFDPARGPLRPWILQIAHFRIANKRDFACMCRVPIRPAAPG